MNYKYVYWVLLLLVMMLWASVSNATESNATESRGYLSVGLGLEYNHGLYQTEETKAQLIVNGAYYWSNGFFIEFPGRANKFNPDIAAGYHFYSTSRWEFDAIASLAHGDIDFAMYGTKVEKIGSAYIGVRATGEVAGLDVQAIVAPLILQDDYDGGAYASLWLSKSWFIKNTQVYASVGAQYRDAKILNFYYGTEGLPDAWNMPDYKADAGINTSVQIGATYPLSNKMVVDVYGRFTQLADSITDSPVAQSVLTADSSRTDSETQFGISLSYVF